MKFQSPIIRIAEFDEFVSEYLIAEDLRNANYESHSHRNANRRKRDRARALCGFGEYYLLGRARSRRSPRGVFDLLGDSRPRV